MLVVLLSGLLLTGCSSAAEGTRSRWAVADYAGRFEYRFGDPRAAAHSAFADPRHEDGGWLPARRIGNQSGRRGASVLWLRTRLEGPVLEHPVLSLRLAAHSVTLYVEGQPVVPRTAELGPIDQLTKVRGEYLVSLPADYSGKVLALRLVSEAPPFGIEAVPRLGEATVVTFDLIRRRADIVLCGLLLMLFALSGGVMFLLHRRDWLYMHFATGSLAFALSMFGICGIGGLLYPLPLPSYPLHALGNALGNIGVASFVILLLDAGPFQVLRWFRRFATLYIVLYLAAMALRPSFVFQLAVMQRSQALLLALCFFATAVRGIRRGDAYARFFCGGLLATTLTSVPEYLIMWGLYEGEIGRTFVPTVLLFLGTLALILVRRFIASQSKALQLQIEHRLAGQRLKEQESLLLASARMARGDFEQPILVEPVSPLLPLATALDDMRQDLRNKLQLLDRVQTELRSKVETLETRNQEVDLLNIELRRQIAQHSRRLLETLRPSGGRALSTGELLGTHYRIVRMLGQGGMGTVYEVVRTTDARRLAAKVLRSAVLDKTATGRFAREAQIMARLNHPNLVAISDVDVTEDGMLYLVMELIEGCSLSQLRDRFSDVQWDRSVLAQIAEALAALHSQGIVHRDVKPENVLVSGEGVRPRIKLADFGISWLADEIYTQPLSALSPEEGASGAETPLPQETPEQLHTEEIESEPRNRFDPFPAVIRSAEGKRLPRATPERALTQTGVIMGTPGYMAPELLRGVSRAQPSADVYSLGVMAVEMFTGKRPSAGRSLLSHGLDGRATGSALLREGPGLDAALIGLIERALAVEPGARPTAQELARALNVD